jgi:hypothetical protein
MSPSKLACLSLKSFFQANLIFASEKGKKKLCKIDTSSHCYKKNYQMLGLARVSHSNFSLGCHEKHFDLVTLMNNKAFISVTPGRHVMKPFTSTIYKSTY